MGNRFGRKKTRRFKTATSNEQRGLRNEKATSNELLSPQHSVLSPGGRPQSSALSPQKEGNGHFWCKHSEGYISFDVCLIRQTRKPGDCKGCGNFKGAA